MRLIHALRLLGAPQQPDVVALVGAGGKSTALFRLAQEIVADGKRVVTATTTRIFAAQRDQAPAHLAVQGGQIDWAALEQALVEQGQCLLTAHAQGDKALGVPPQVVDAVAERAHRLGLAAIIVEADGARGRPVKAPAPHEPLLPTSTTLLVPILGLDALGLPLAEPHVHRPRQLGRLLGVPGSDARLSPLQAARLLLHPRGGAKGAGPGTPIIPLLNKAEAPPRLAGARLIARLVAEQGRAALIASLESPQSDPVLERWGPTTAVVLAAGGSRRMGTPKQLLQVEGEPLVVRAVRLALQSDASHVLVVTGAEGEAVARTLAPLRSASGGRLHTVHNPRWAAGQSTSIRAALEHLPQATESLLFLPVDQPLLRAALLRLLWRAWQTGGDMVAVTVGGTVRGAPAVFDQRFFPQLATLEGDRGGRSLLRAFPEAVVPIPAQPGWLQDIDTPEDWARLLVGRKIVDD